MKPYYYVYKHGASGPSVKHATLKIAQDEAERLAAKEPGECFEILQCVGYSSTAKASTFWMDGAEPEILPDYRMLQDGDSIREGDEYLSAGEWHKKEYGFGQPFSLVTYVPHRRPL